MLGQGSHLPFWFPFWFPSPQVPSSAGRKTEADVKHLLDDLLPHLLQCFVARRAPEAAQPERLLQLFRVTQLLMECVCAHVRACAMESFLREPVLHIVDTTHLCVLFACLTPFPMTSGHIVLTSPWKWHHLANFGKEQAKYCPLPDR